MQSFPTVQRLALLCALGAVLAQPIAAKDCIGMVPAGTQVFWRQVEAGARQAALDADIELHLRGPRREGSVATQLQLIDKVLEPGCKALIIAPAGPRSTPRPASSRIRGC
ncbi:hypothetical protein ACSX1C_12840 [Pseudomonas sp. MBLB4123]|uniref:hypothetical protein n=1 Tax=Pseudomonas sp. MBLB4123 TaxID=3451557 RepID=UPI003F74E8F3